MKSQQGSPSNTKHSDDSDPVEKHRAVEAGVSPGNLSLTPFRAEKLSRLRDSLADNHRDFHVYAMLAKGQNTFREAAFTNPSQLARALATFEKALYRRLPEAWQTPSLLGLITSLVVRSMLDALETPLPSALVEMHTALTILHQQAVSLLPCYDRQTCLVPWWDDVLSQDPTFQREAHEEALGRLEPDPAPFTAEACLKALQALGAEGSLCQRLQWIVELQEAITPFRVTANRQDKAAQLAGLWALGTCYQMMGQHLQREQAAEAPEVWLRSQLFFNAALTFVEKDVFFEAERPKQMYALQEAIAAVESGLRQTLGVSTSISLAEETEARRAWLAVFRETIDQQVAQVLTLPRLNEDDYYVRAHRLRVIALETVQGIKQFIGALVADCLTVLGPPPCRYALIGYGSLEKQAVTPYSDIEFGILLEEGAPAVAATYFRHLTYLLQAKVINLGESSIPLSWFNVSFDHLTAVGFCLDLGGKTPLGRAYNYPQDGKRYGQPKYTLIQTPCQMLAYVEDDWFAVDRLLPVEAGRCTHLVGDATLTTEYQRLLHARFQQVTEEKPFYQHRAMALLGGNRYLAGDVDTYEPKMKLEDEGRPYQVKQEIYRLSDRLIDSLAFFYGITVESTWEKLEALTQQSVLTKEACRHLQVVDGIAQELRLRTYRFHHCQQENLGIGHKLEGGHSDAFHLGQDTGLIERFYYTALPFYVYMKAWIHGWKEGQLQGAFTTACFYEANEEARTQIACRLGDYGSAQRCLEQQLESHPEDANVLYRLGLVHLQARQPSAAKEILTRTLALRETHDGSDHIQTALTLRNLASAYGELGNAQTQKALLERVLIINERAYGPDHVEIAITLNNLATAYAILGDAKTAKALQERALRISEYAYGPNHVKTAFNLNNLANVYGELGEAQTKKALMERALIIIERHYGPDHVETAVILDSLANAYLALGDATTAKALMERALIIKERAYGPDHVQSVLTLTNIGITYFSLGDAKAAKVLLERGLLISERTYGPDHAQTAVILTNLGNAYLALGDATTAKALQERALIIKERVYGPDHIQTAMTLGNLANAMSNLGDTKTQKALLERVLIIQERVYGLDHVQTAMTLGNLAGAYLDFGDATTAKALQERALIIKERAYGPDHVQTASTLTNLANAMGALGDTKAKQALLERALVIFERAYGPDHVQTATALDSLASAMGALGDHQTKKVLLERALDIFERTYGPDHVNTASTLNNLANATGALGDVKTKKVLLERALLINERAYGLDHVQTALSVTNLATAYLALGDTDLAKVLLKKAYGNVINYPGYGQNHPLAQQIKQIEQGVEQIAFFQSLHQAASVGDESAVRQIMPAESISARNFHDYIIHKAVVDGDLALVSYTLDQGAAIDTEDSEGNTPLEWASEKNAAGIPLMQLLLERGADINHQNKDGNSLLHLRARAGHQEAIEFLLAQGIDAQLRNQSGQRALDMALKANQSNVVKLLLAVNFSQSLAARLSPISPVPDLRLSQSRHSLVAQLGQTTMVLTAVHEETLPPPREEGTPSDEGEVDEELRQALALSLQFTERPRTP